MAAPSTSHDPRSIVTPEAFHVSEDLVGMQLASPGRRLAAVFIDLVFISILTAVTRSFALVFGLVIAAALLRASTRRTEVRHNVFDRARRLSIGCLGVTIGFFTLLIGAAILFEDDLEEVFDEEFLSELAERQGMVVEVGPDGEVTIREPEDSSLVAGAEDPIEPRDVDAVRDGVTLYATEEALEAYLELRREGVDDTSDPMDRALLAALEARLATDLAADTLVSLQERIDELERESGAAAEELQDALEELQDAESGGGGFVSTLLDFLDELGFGFGWAALYTTVLLSVMNGQTLGKRFLGIRVVRLDGQRINWWVAFERAGGYAAGFATGLLGFAQVYWDSNRQAIHDRIVGTVVLRDGAERVTDWESAL